MRIILLAAAAIFFHAPERAWSSQPSKFLTDSYGQTYNQKALGSGCSAIDPFKKMLPCNPAFLAFETPTEMGFHIHFGNNISQLGYVDEALDGDFGFALEEDLFLNRRPLYAEANSEIQFRMSKWAIGITPYHARLYTRFKNSALPQVEALALEEKSIRLQLGTYSERDMHWGLQLRFVDRELLSEEFTLFEALLDESGLESVQQYGLYIEPGFLLEREDDPWRLALTSSIHGAGFVSNPIEGFEAKPVFNFGVSMSPSFTYGDLSLALNLEVEDDNRNLGERLELASAFRMGVATASARISAQSYSVGVLANHYGFEGGILYIDQVIGEDVGTKAINDESVQAHFGVRF